MTRCVLLSVMTLTFGLIGGGCPPPEVIDPNTNDNSQPSENDNSSDARAINIAVDNPERRVLEGSLELTWRAIRGATAYRLYFGTDEDPELLQSVAINRFTVRDLQSCRTYYWRIEAIMPEGEAKSETVSFKTICGAELPLDPAYPAPAHEDYGVNLTPMLVWQESVRADEYDVYFGTATNPPLLTTTTNPALALEDELTPGAQYHWRVVAKNDAGEVSSPMWQFRTQPIRNGPRPPRLVSPANGAIEMATRIRLNWNDIENATEYDLYLDKNLSPTTLHATTTATHFDLAADLDLNQTYYWRVEARAANAAVSSPAWNFRTIATHRAPLPAARPIPADGAFQIAGLTEFSWEVDPYVDEYDVYFGPDDSPTFLTTVAEERFTANIEAGTSYTWFVVARNAHGEQVSTRWRLNATRIDLNGGTQNGDSDNAPPTTSSAETVSFASIGCLHKLIADGRGGIAAQPNLDITSDGNWIAFATGGALVPGDTNGVDDVYVANLETGTVQRASVGTGGTQASAGCGWPRVSDDGRFVIFTTRASLSNDDTDDFDDVYLHDRVTQQTTFVSTDATDWHALGTAISGDGRFVCYLIGRGRIMRYDRAADTLTRVDRNSNGEFSTDNGGTCAISFDGRYVVFNARFPNAAGNRICVRDLNAGITTITNFSGLLYGSPMSANGQAIVVTEIAATSPQRVQIRLIRPFTGTSQVIGTEYFTGGADDADVSWLASISGDGNVVTFVNYAQLRSTKPLLHAYNVSTGVQWNVSATATGAPAIGTSFPAALNEDGSRILFTSGAGNLVPGVGGNLFLSECGP